MLFKAFFPGGICKGIYFRWESFRETKRPLFRGYEAHHSGQIIATSHDLTPNGGLVREIT